jgi:hypothetical protein
MDRKAIIAKIQAMLKLQEQTSFEGEASAAAALIDKLCKQNEITLEEATATQILDESIKDFKRIDQSYALIVGAVADFYDAKAYLQHSSSGKSLKVIGSEAQQIQVQLYSEFLMEVMDRECKLAYEGEKLLAELTGKEINRSFIFNFKKAFAGKIYDRLREMKIEENRVHEDKEAVQNTLSTMRFGRSKFTSAKGSGAYAGTSAGESASLNRQASGGGQQKRLTGS